MTPDFNFADPDRFHKQLARFNATRVAPGVPVVKWQQTLLTEFAHRLDEGEYLENLRAQVAFMIPKPDGDSANFVSWFQSLMQTGPGQHHPLFDWLAEHATLPQMRWFLTQEVSGEAGFEDLLAYTQVKLPAQAKLECARNYWDEMGHGKELAMHGQMLERMVRELDLQPSIDTTVWEALALSNTMLGLAMSRRYTYHALGALGVIELTAPGRVSKVSTGMRRLGMNNRMRAYFDLHATQDVTHAHAWIQEIIQPLVEADPTCAQYIAEGALMRLVCGQRCFERYSRELRIDQSEYNDASPQSVAREEMELHC